MTKSGLISSANSRLPGKVWQSAEETDDFCPHLHPEASALIRVHVAYVFEGVTMRMIRATRSDASSHKWTKSDDNGRGC